MNKIIPTTILLTLLAARPARAEGEQATGTGTVAMKRHTFLAYAKVGGLFPVHTLSPFVTFHLGAGYILPVLKHRLSIIADLGYTQNTADGTIGPDPRLGASGATFNYSLTHRDLGLFIGPQVYLLDPARRFVPYAAVGVDLHFLKDEITGKGNGNELGQNTEVSTKAGFALRAGAGYRLGPGLITGEVTFGWAPINHEVTGDSNLGRVSILVGYLAMMGFGS
jgi:hypothetical protein